MTYDQFIAAVKQPVAPEEATAALRALWQDARGDWDAAHSTAQDIDDETGAWVHAYLHRKEGDLGNAAYWYRRAGKPAATDALSDEWERIARSLIETGPLTS